MVTSGLNAVIRLECAAFLWRLRSMSDADQDMVSRAESDLCCRS